MVHFVWVKCLHGFTRRFTHHQMVFSSFLLLQIREHKDLFSLYLKILLILALQYFIPEGDKSLKYWKMLSMHKYWHSLDSITWSRNVLNWALGVHQRLSEVAEKSSPFELQSSISCDLGVNFHFNQQSVSDLTIAIALLVSYFPEWGQR